MPTYLNKSLQVLEDGSFALRRLGWSTSRPSFKNEERRDALNG